MTPAQLTTLKAHILANYASEWAQGAANLIASHYNEMATPDFYLWKSSYSPDELRASLMNGITQLDALAASKRDSLLWLIQGNLDMRVTQSRTALDDLTGSQNTLKNALLDGGKRKANVAEKMFATGTGSLASPAIADFEGTVSAQTVYEAMSNG